MSIKLASESLNACSGCEMALLNLGDAFLDLLLELEFVHIPILMDHKYYGSMGDKKTINIPAAKIGLLSGGIRNKDHLKIAFEMRKKCEILIGLGTCATHGGIPAMINMYSNQELFDQYFSTGSIPFKTRIPDKEVPELLDRCYALDEQINVDFYLPGCPPHPDNINEAIHSILNGKKPETDFKSVCDTCPAIRNGKGKIRQIKREVTSPEFDPEKPVDDMQCLLEQGFMCAGPVTRSGCSGKTGTPPGCIYARVPCRGCYGPVKQDANPFLDMLNALASNDIDINTLPDPGGLLRFSGAHNRLICIKKEKS